MKIAIIGDIHFPGRADDLPNDFFEMIVEENVDLVIYTGDLDSKKTLEILKSLGKELIVVKGNVDYLDLPEREILEIGKYRILVFHSSEVKPRGDLEKIKEIAKKENCNVVIFGHTHMPLFTFKGGIFFINPGSATGVISGDGKIPPRSFAILEILDDKFFTIKFFVKPRWDIW